MCIYIIIIIVQTLIINFPWEYAVDSILICRWQIHRDLFSRTRRCLLIYFFVLLGKVPRSVDKYRVCKTQRVGLRTIVESNQIKSVRHCDVPSKPDFYLRSDWPENLHKLEQIFWIFFFFAQLFCSFFTHNFAIKHFPMQRKCLVQYQSMYFKGTCTIFCLVFLYLVDDKIYIKQ